MKEALTMAIFIALLQRGWDVYAALRTRVIRSPDRKLYIISDYCTPQEVIEIVNQWQPTAEVA